MPRKEPEHRQLLPAFVTYLDKHHVFPGRDDLRRWSNENKRIGFANKFYTPLRQAQPVPRSVIEVLVRYFVLPDKSGRLPARASAVLEHCRSLGLQSVDLAYLPQIVERISASTTAPPRRPLDHASAFITTLAENAVAVHSGFKETDEADLARSIEWIAVEYGRQLKRRALSYRHAYTTGFRSRGTTLKEYLNQLRDWRKITPLVSGMAFDNGAPVGATIALPLREQSYRRVRAGVLNTRDLRPEDLSPTSRFLFLEAVVMAPHQTTAAHKHPTALVAGAFIAQLALLNRVRDIAKDPPLHLMSATFSELSRQRLEGLGCSIIGARHADTNHELMERVVDISRPNNEDAAFWGNWRSLQRQLTHLRGEAPPTSTIQSKARASSASRSQKAKG